MRALVGIFTVLLILISLYQLSFTWFINKHESEMEKIVRKEISALYPSHETQYSDNPDLQAAYNDSVSAQFQKRLEEVLDSTSDKKITWWGQTYEKAKEEELLLGLDLQGGINVTLDVALDGLIRGLSNNPQDSSLNAAIAEGLKRKLTSDKNFTLIFAETYKDLYPNRPLAPLFANPSRNNLTANSTDAQVISFINSQANEAMNQTFQVLSRRIDKFGVAQPNINLDENRGIITVELAGATDAERVRRYLQSTANLQFWEVATFNQPNIINGFQNAITAIDNYSKAQSGTVDTTANADSLAAANLMNNQLLQIFQPASPFMGQDGVQSFGAELGYAAIRDTGKVTELLNLPAVKRNFPGNIKFLWGKQSRDADGKLMNFLPLYAIETIPGKTGSNLEGEVIVSAEQGFDPITNEVIVTMTMNNAGARVWANMTERSAKDRKPIAIVLDDIVYSAPVASERIEGGSSRITMGGRGTSNRQNIIVEAQDLSNILKSGKLDAPARIVQEQVVGPTLGKEAISGGINSFIIAFIVIFALMLLYYNTGGFIANIALILNLLFTIGILAAMGGTLTAAGIAGIVLTIGVAVDTNVIIFERIKDELGRGLTREQAVVLGYKLSLPPVLDANITSLLTAVILFIYGLGPVLGFATTQIIGILMAMFTGVMVSRLITDFLLKKGVHLKYFTGISKRVFARANYQFIKYRKYSYVVSGIILLLAIGSYFNGFKQGVEFSGGRSYVVKFTKAQDADQIREALTEVFDESPVVKTYGITNTEFDITTDYLINEEGLVTDSIVRNTLFTGLQPFLPENTSLDKFTKDHILQTKKVDPTISDDLKNGAKWATFWAVLAIALYIFIRFRDWRYSVGTLVALAHDVLVTIIVFSYFKDIVPFPLEIDQHFIAAILTVIGFSMNDTVVVYDRIREDARNLRGVSKEAIINGAINKTLGRTIMTSLTVLLAILVLFLVGSEVTRGFAFAMLIGVITGIYSTIFIASPILIDMAKSKPLGDAKLFGKESTPEKKAKPVA